MLRLAAARRRIAAFLDQISDLELSEFPHGDGKEALRLIRADIEQRQRSLARTPDTVAAETVDEMCAATSNALRQNTEVLGFILRSTNVRNAFEVHFPLKRLIGDAISSKARLIMSSEWDFVPFTYPMTLPLLPDFILVGGPAPESGNLLIIPLAGHEIGHSAWRSGKIVDNIMPELRNAVAAALAAEPSRFNRVMADLQRTGQNLSKLHNDITASALKQLEEIYCDVFGLYVFGEGYAFAYEYLLAPGTTQRHTSYPASEDRIRYLLQAAVQIGLDIDPNLFSPWQSSKTVSGTVGDMLVFADAAVAAMFGTVSGLAIALLRQRGVPPCNPAAVERCKAAFEMQVPDGGGATLAEIVTAGWIRLRQRGGMADEAQAQERLMLNELMLKSVEVSEFMLRVADA